MDSLASLALATETPKDDLLKRPPYRKKEYIISQKMVKHILGMSIYQSILLFFFLFVGYKMIPEDPDTSALDFSKHEVDEYKNWDPKIVMNGAKKAFDGSEIYGPFEDDTPSRHLTIFFNVFVLM